MSKYRKAEVFIGDGEDLTPITEVVMTDREVRTLVKRIQTYALGCQARRDEEAAELNAKLQELNPPK